MYLPESATLLTREASLSQLAARGLSIPLHVADLAPRGLTIPSHLAALAPRALASIHAHLTPRGLNSAPPPARTWLDDNPTLLVSWWVTLFSVTIILFRLAGRWIRTERLFLEDKIMALSIVPLLIRMAFAHLVLRNGTNNAVTAGLGAADIANRELGSRLVLGARIFYAMFLWIAKLTVTEFLHRLCQSMWKRSWNAVLNGIRGFLGATFVAVVIATLSECRPFDHYWQVVPDPGPQCRQGYAQLLTMGVADIVTDLTLVAFPVYIMFQSNMRLRRKFTLSLLFGLSLILVAITSYRVTGTIQRASSQQFRTLVASLEILAATFVANALVLGSFMRDKGVKKAKFNKTYGSVGTESVLDRPTSRTRPRGVQSWGSDTDLVGDLGMRFAAADGTGKPRVARPAPVATPLRRDAHGAGPPSEDASPTDTRGMDLRIRTESLRSDDGSGSGSSSDLKAQRHARHYPVPGADPTPRRMSFFDVGGLLDDPPLSVHRRPSAVRRSSSRGDGRGEAFPLEEFSVRR